MSPARRGVSIGLFLAALAVIYASDRVVADPQIPSPPWDRVDPAMSLVPASPHPEHVTMIACVRDASTGNPLSESRIRVESSGETTRADSSGCCVLRNVPAGPQALMVWCPHYFAKPIQATFSPASTDTLIVRLKYWEHPEWSVKERYRQ